MTGSEDKHGMDRRTFVRRAAVAAGTGAALAGALPGTGAEAFAAAGAGTQAKTQSALSGGQMKTLEALLARLLPKDELGPGAVEVGVPTYIDRALAGPYAELVPAYAGFLSTLDRSARAAGGGSFRALPPDAQDKLLEEAEAGKAPGLSAADRKAAAETFPLVLSHLREGMFSDPMYGGNKDLAGWKLIGYPGIQLVVSKRLQEVGTKVPETGMTAEKYGGAPFDGPGILNT